MLDVFLESGDPLDREQVEETFARHGIGADSIVTTADGGEASVSLDDDGAVFVVRSLTRDLARVIFEVAGEANVPDELDAVDVRDAEALFEALRRSEGLRGARTA